MIPTIIYFRFEQLEMQDFELNHVSTGSMYIDDIQVRYTMVNIGVKGRIVDFRRRKFKSCGFSAPKSQKLWIFGAKKFKN